MRQRLHIEIPWILRVGKLEVKLANHQFRSDQCHYLRLHYQSKKYVSVDLNLTKLDDQNLELCNYGK